MSKTCKRCQKNKPASEYYPKSGGKLGVTAVCADCQRSEARSRYVKTTPVPKSGHKFCSRCKREAPLSEYYMRFKWGKMRPMPRCIECSKETCRERYAQNPEASRAKNKGKYTAAKRAGAARHRLKNRHKTNARLATHYLILTGILKRQPCEICGEQKAEAHHEDYSDPMNIKWLCRFHHLRHHGLNKHCKEPLND